TLGEEATRLPVFGSMPAAQSWISSVRTVKSVPDAGAIELHWARKKTVVSTRPWSAPNTLLGALPGGPLYPMVAEVTSSSGPIVLVSALGKIVVVGPPGREAAVARWTPPEPTRVRSTVFAIVLTPAFGVLEATTVVTAWILLSVEKSGCPGLEPKPRL